MSLAEKLLAAKSNGDPEKYLAGISVAEAHVAGDLINEGARFKKVAEEAYWLLAWTWQSHLFHFCQPFDMTAFAPEAREMMNKGEQDLFDALSALPSPAQDLGEKP